MDQHDLANLSIARAITLPGITEENG